jgi:hypothetical protein
LAFLIPPSFFHSLAFSLSSLLTSSPSSIYYLPAHERLAVRTRLRKDLADSRWKTVGNGNQNLIRTKAATPETTRNFEFRIFFLNIYLFFSLALTYRYITDVYRTRHIGMPALFSQFPADLKLKQIPNSNKQIVKIEEERDSFDRFVNLLLRDVTPALTVGGSRDLFQCDRCVCLCVALRLHTPHSFGSQEFFHSVFSVVLLFLLLSVNYLTRRWVGGNNIHQVYLLFIRLLNVCKLLLLGCL